MVKTAWSHGHYKRVTDGRTDRQTDKPPVAQLSATKTEEGLGQPIFSMHNDNDNNP